MIVRKRKSGQRRPSCDPVRGLLMNTKQKNPRLVQSGKNHLPSRPRDTTDKGGRQLFLFFLTISASTAAIFCASAASAMVTHSNAVTPTGGTFSFTTDQSLTGTPLCNIAIASYPEQVTIDEQDDLTVQPDGSCMDIVTDGALDADKQYYANVQFNADAGGESYSYLFRTQLDLSHDVKAGIQTGIYAVLKPFFGNLLLIVGAVAAILITLWGLAIVFSFGRGLGIGFRKK